MTQFKRIFMHVQRWLRTRVNIVQVRSTTTMSILNYFRKEHSLPTTESTALSERTVEEANKSGSKTLECKGEAAGRKRKATQHSDVTRAKLGKYAAVHGVAAAQRHFKKELGDLPESTLRKFKYKTLYTKELAVIFELAVRDI